MSEQTSRQPWEHDVLAADGAFFTALVEGVGPALVLADQFILVGVNDGAVVPREVLLMDQAQLRFDAIVPDASAVPLQRYGSTVIVVGRTRISGRWRLASSQGTPIVSD